MFKLEKIIFYIFAFCLPFQTRIIVFKWGDGFNEWTSAFFYLTDLLVIGFLVLWLKRFNCPRKKSKALIGLAIFLFVALLSLSQTGNKWLGFYWWLKLVELALLFLYVKYNLGKFLKIRNLVIVLIASGLFQSLVAVGQYVGQKSLGLKLLGESWLGPNVIGVANFAVAQKLIMRAYGTLPHPNVLAAFLILSIFCLYWFYFNILANKNTNKSYYLFGLSFLLLSLGLWLTFSRTVMFFFFVFSCLYFLSIYLKKNQRPALVILVLFFVILNLVLGICFFDEILARSSLSLSDQAVSLRLDYNQKAFKLIASDPLLGIGLGNFVWTQKQIWPNLDNWLYQPAHNIYLLIASETGLLGLAAFVYLLFQVLAKKVLALTKKTNKFASRNSFLWLFLIFIFIGLFDHFFWTLQQGQLMWWLVLGILASRSGNSHEKIKANKKP